MNRTKILLVEDELDLAEPIVQGLREEHFDVEHAPTGEIARRKLEQHFDLLILDLMLPDMPGEAIIDYLKQRTDYPAILVLTARAGVQDKLALFRRGCDDYLTKPFVFEELLERVRALLRRSQRVAASHCIYEDLELDPDMHRLTVGKETIVLTPKEAAICRLLLSEPGRIVSRKEILQGVWGLKEEPTSNLVGIHVFNLRKKFAQLGREDWFHTIRNSGFVVSRPELMSHGH